MSRSEDKENDSERNLKNSALNVGDDVMIISLISPEWVRKNSYGEVTRSDTVNYRTFKPEARGPMCAQIFGPVKNYMCICGKYKQIKYKGIICERCGVEVTTTQVRRERMGHIELAAPVAHVWFSKSLPSHIGTLLEISTKNLDAILYFERYIVTDPGLTELKTGDIMNVHEYKVAQEKYGHRAFEAMMGAEAIEKLLDGIDLQAEYQRLRDLMNKTDSILLKKKILRRYKMIDGFLQSNSKPSWMIIRALPVLPADIRPLVPLQGGRFATSDLNVLYCLIINRNNRLKKLLTLNAPKIIVDNEKRMLQQAVDAFYENGRRMRPIKNNSNSNKPLKPLAQMLSGKHGRFRQNLLGKRLDFSARSVITVGPKLKLHQCGLPKAIALELFKYFLYARLEKYGLSNSIKKSKMMVEKELPIVWDLLEEVVKDYLIIINRAPTLHALGMLAFEVILIDDHCIQLHPLVCMGFNADFDGDQVAVHLPLSIEAQMEARLLMMATNHLFVSSSGQPAHLISKDMVFGLYYLTMSRPMDQSKIIFSSCDQAILALNNNYISLHQEIECRVEEIDLDGNKTYKRYITTPGRVVLFKHFPKKPGVLFEWANKVLTKKDGSALYLNIHRFSGHEAYVKFVDDMMTLTFQYCTQSGLSLTKDEIAVPAEKPILIEETQKKINEYYSQFNEGLITYNERYNKTIATWTKCSTEILDLIKKQLNETDISGGMNSLHRLALSGARVTAEQMRQIQGMCGLISLHTGAICDVAIVGSYIEGLSSFEFFAASPGARKGLVDTAMKTSASGYFTRRLVDVAQDCVVTQEDCQTKRGVMIRSVIENNQEVISLAERVFGRVVSEDIRDPISNEIIIPANTCIEYKEYEYLQKTPMIRQCKIRSPVTCELIQGVCASCYGYSLSTRSRVSVGFVAGVIAAQSLGEPTTQLTMRTFHAGGAAHVKTEESSAVAKITGIISFEKVTLVTNSQNETINIGRRSCIHIMNAHGVKIVSHAVPYGAVIFVQDKQNVEIDTMLAEWNVFHKPLVSEVSGQVMYFNLLKDVSMKETLDEKTGHTYRTVLDWQQHIRGKDLRPQINIVNAKGEILINQMGQEARYFLSPDASLNVENGDHISAGDLIARLPREAQKTSDITGGLHEIVNLFEARPPKDHGIMSTVAGIVQTIKEQKNKKRFFVKPYTDETPIEISVSRGRHILVQEGDVVEVGDILVDGPLAAHDILQIMGVEHLTTFMVDGVQEVYRAQGIRVHDKHIEIIVRYMLRHYEITDSGDSILMPGDHIDIRDLTELNEELTKINGRRVHVFPVLQGITKASISTNSFLAAASFQDTARVLTLAAILQQVDYLRGIKANMIACRLITAGVGLSYRKYVDMVKAQYAGEEPAAPQKIRLAEIAAV